MQAKLRTIHLPNVRLQGHDIFFQLKLRQKKNFENKIISLFTKLLE